MDSWLLSLFSGYNVTLKLFQTWPVGSHSSWLGVLLTRPQFCMHCRISWHEMSRASLILPQPSPCHQPFLPRALTPVSGKWRLETDMVLDGLGGFHSEL